MRLLFTLSLLLAGSTLHAEIPPKFRTDADGRYSAEEAKKLVGKEKDTVLQWFQLIDGEFPPEGSAHAIAGDLIWMDHLERRFHLRVDRDDTQDRAVWDLAVDATMLPYGSIYNQGAPAAIQDIPLGTHLHGLFYWRASSDTTPPPPGPFNRKTPDVDFRRCFRIEDDFSHYARQGQLWKIDAVDLALKKLTATLHHEGKAVGEPKIFDLLSHTRVFQGNGFGTLDSLKKDQTVLFNLTWVTQYGPGRLTDIWVDEPARQLATANQMERHRNHTRERGLAGWVGVVDDEAETVTITFFGGVNPKLFDELSLTNGEPMGWPLSKEADDPNAPKGTIAVALENLMTYDPVNDRKGGNILAIEKVPVEPGSGGVRIKVKCDMMLEGFRPRRIVRFYPATWKVESLPREEKFEGRE